MTSSPLSAPDSAELPRPELVAAIPRLRRYAQVLTRNAARADDLMQDTLARAWEKRKLWQAGSDVRAWLFAIMHNVYVNHCVLARREAGSIPLDSDENGTALQIADRGDPLARVEINELARHVERLPAEQREVLLLVAVEGMSYKEIASALAVPIGTVMSRLSRARARLIGMAEP